MLDCHPTEYQLNTRRHYKIWFSRNPDEFLSIENKIRCIRFKLSNPDCTLHLLYSSTILSTTAKMDLSDFCRNIGIQTLDFDEEVQALLSHTYDHTLYAIAKAEIQHAVDERGGNLGAASDCVRLITGVIERCGIYSDFDVEIQFKETPPILTVQAPVLLPIVLSIHDNVLEKISYNNEFMAFAHDPSNLNTLSVDGLKGLRHVQEQLILRYSRPIEALTAPIMVGLPTSIAMNAELTAVVNHLQQKSNTELSIFSIRQSFEKLTIQDLILSAFAPSRENILIRNAATHTLTENDLAKALGRYLRPLRMRVLPEQTPKINDETIAHQALQRIQSLLYQATVTHISGPYLAIAFFFDSIQHFHFSSLLKVEPSLERDTIIRCLTQASLKENGLADGVIGQDRVQTNAPSNDESWTKKGAEYAAERSSVYLKAILTLQHAIRTRHKQYEKRASSSQIDLKPIWPTIKH